MTSISRRARTRQSLVAFAASGGGHLELLDQARDLVPPDVRCWVTVPGARAETLRAQGERVYTLPPLDRRNLDAHNLRRSLGLARRLRPQVVLTSGAGVVVTFAAASHALGAKIIFAETMARVSAPSATGRVMNRLAAARIVQWPDLAASYQHPHVCRPTLLPRIVPESAENRAGTFVSLGTHPAPFTRLLDMIDSAAKRGVLPRPIVAQLGDARPRSPDIEVRPWMSRGEFQAQLAGAELVIGHCGAGFLGAAISLGQRPLVLPRLGSRSEHVDDHQLQLFDKLSELDLIVGLTEEIGAAEIERAADGVAGRELFVDTPEVHDVLAAELKRLVPSWNV